MNDERDAELERYLNEFRPRGITALNAQSIRRPARWARVAAAVVIIGIATAGAYVWRHQNNVPTKEHASTEKSGPSAEAGPRTSVGLTRLALEDNAKFERVLAEKSRVSLPNLRGDQSTLRVLANE